MMARRGPAPKSMDYLLAMRQVIAGGSLTTPLEKALAVTMKDDKKAFMKAYLSAEADASKHSAENWDGKGKCPLCGQEPGAAERPMDEGSAKAMQTIDRILATFAP